MRTVLLALLWSFIIPLSSFSQYISAGHIPEDLLKGRVKQIEEFIARFNYQENWQGGKAVNPSDNSMRAKYLHTLFDYNRFRSQDGKLSPVAERFIRDVVNNGYKINFTDSSWVARVQSSALVGGKKTSITLYLQVERVSQYEYVWVISNVECPMFTADKKEISHPFLSPVEHETGFIGLLSVASLEGIDVDRLYKREYVPDKLSMLAFLLRNGMIKFTEIENVSFHFFNVPGYAFTIERLNRKGTYNTGWLITSLNDI